MTQMARMAVASLKMLYRDQQSVVFAAVSPVIFVGLLALLSDLRLGVGPTTLDFLDFVVPGMAAFWIMYFAIYAMSAAAAGYQAAGILKRIAASPASPTRFVVAQVAARVAIGVIQAAVVFAVGAALGANLDTGASLGWLVPLAAVGTLIALNLGFVIAGVSGTPEGAAS
jgi:ABC-2 type transport system permease protein